LIDLLGKILVKDPKNRISIEEICNHSWVNIDYDKPPLIIPPREDPKNPSKFAKHIKSVHNENEFTVYSINPINPKAAAMTAETVEKVRIATARKRAESFTPVQTSIGNFFSPASPISINQRKFSDTGLVSARKSEANMLKARRSSHSSSSNNNSKNSKGLDRSYDMASPMSQGSFTWSRRGSRHSIEVNPNSFPRKRSGSFTQSIVLFNQLSLPIAPQTSEHLIKEESSSEASELSGIADKAESFNKEKPGIIIPATNTDHSLVNEDFEKSNLNSADASTPKGSIFVGSTRRSSLPRISALSADTDTSTVRPAGWSTTERKPAYSRVLSFQAEYSIAETGEEYEASTTAKKVVEDSRVSNELSSNGSPELKDGEGIKLEMFHHNPFQYTPHRRTSSYAKKDTLAITIPTAETTDHLNKSRMGRRSTSRRTSRVQGESSLRNSVTRALSNEALENEAIQISKIKATRGRDDNRHSTTKKDSDSIYSSSFDSSLSKMTSASIDSGMSIHRHSRAGTPPGTKRQESALNPKPKSAGADNSLHLGVKIGPPRHSESKPASPSRKRATTITESISAKQNTSYKPEKQTEEVLLSKTQSTDSSTTDTPSSKKYSDFKSEITAPSYTEIQSWHDTHKPAKIIRTVRFPFRKGLASFELEPARMFVDLHDVLCQLTEIGILNRFNFEFIRPNPDYYLFEIKVDFEGSKLSLKFDAEICKLWMLKMHGVRMKRIQGDAFDFKYFHGLIIDGIGYK
jgi:Kinase associated domain 1